MTVLAHAAGTDETATLVLLFAGIWTAWIGWSRLRGTGFERLPTWGAWALIGGAALLVVSATFLPRRLLGPTTAPVATGPRPSSAATLRFLSPENGAKTSAAEITVQMALDGGTLTQATSSSLSPTTGHLHLSLDGSLVSMSGDTTQVVDVRTLAPGEHTLTAEFVATDHLPFDPPVTATTTFVKVASS
jgi:hypothetical protein